MIRYSITEAKLKQKIVAAKATFFDDAQAVLDALPNPPKSSDFKPLWSDIKQVYIELQCSKCCFCEKPLEGKISQDVEHFRPKAEVKNLKLAKKLTDAGVALSQPANDTSEPGYKNLAYQPFNYAISCKQCNSVLKKNFFPIAGTRKSNSKNPATMKGEKAFLIYPIASIDDDPEELIEFEGLSPRPKAAAGHNRLRGLVTIELFKLDNVAQRRMLFKGRAILLRLLFLELQARDATANPAKKQKHQDAIDAITGPQSPFANCMRCYERLFASDPTRAEQFADECLEFMKSKSL